MVQKQPKLTREVRQEPDSSIVQRKRKKSWKFFFAPNNIHHFLQLRSWLSQWKRTLFWKIKLFCNSKKRDSFLKIKVKRNYLLVSLERQYNGTIGIQNLNYSKGPKSRLVQILDMYRPNCPKSGLASLDRFIT